MCDLLDPALKDSKQDCEGEFQGMAITEIPLSALRWKLMNIQKMDKTRHKVQLDKLKY